MAIDDHPFDVIERRDELETALSSPVPRRIAAALGDLPLPWPVDKAVDKIRNYLEGDRIEKVELLLQVVKTEVRRHETGLAEIAQSTRPDELDVRWKDWLELLQDGARKAEQTRVKSRVERIGWILANALVSDEPPVADEVEDFMRIAMELSDVDIRCLAELFWIEGGQLETQEHLSRYTAFRIWESGWRRTTINPEIDSVFGKLESFGLVTGLAPPNDLNVTADFQHRYALLKRGARFIKCIRSSASMNQDLPT